jgi:hypothetical protein
MSVVIGSARLGEDDVNLYCEAPLEKVLDAVNSHTREERS